MADKKAEPKLYFKSLPKEEVFKFLENFKKTLAEAPKSEEKKSTEFSIVGSTEDLKGIAVETHDLTKEKYKELFDDSQEHIKKALFISTFSFNAKDEASVATLKGIYDKFAPLVKEIPFVKKHPENYELNFRSSGTKVFVDFTSVQGEFLKPFLDLGLDLTDYHKIDSTFKSELSPEDFFNLPAEELSLKVLKNTFTFKSQSTGIRQIVTAAIKALKEIKLANAQLQKKLEEHIENLNIINAFVSFVFSFEFDGKELGSQGLAAASQTFLKGVDLNKKLEETRANILGFGKNVLKGLIDQYGLTDAVKSANVDDLTLAFGCPKYQNGLIHTIHLPGFTKAFVDKVLN